MRVDTYTKVVLTAIALALCSIAGKQYVHPPATVHAAGQFSSLQFAEDKDWVYFFDSSTGTLYEYDETHTGSIPPSSVAKMSSVGGAVVIRNLQ